METSFGTPSPSMCILPSLYPAFAYPLSRHLAKASAALTGSLSTPLPSRSMTPTLYSPMTLPASAALEYQ